MSDIKVRMWNPHGPHYHYGIMALECLIQQTSGMYDHIKEYGACFELFIGKKDKNNKEIYEGHILKFYREGEWFAWGSCFYDDEETAFRHRFQEVHNGEPDTGSWRPPKRFWTNDDFQCEIIGNIHENPELLI